MIALLIAVAFASAPMPPSNVDSYQSCISDDDCIYATNGSCDCNNGGAPVAINKTQLEAFKKNFDKVECPANVGARCDWGKASCVQNRCYWTPAKAPAPYRKKK